MGEKMQEMKFLLKGRRREKKTELRDHPAERSGSKRGDGEKKKITQEYL